MTKKQLMLLMLFLMFGTVLYLWMKVQQESYIGPPEFKHVTLNTSHEELARVYDDYVNTVQVKCNKIVRHGNLGDGGWDVCMDPPYELKKPCLVYSFGIADDWSFDDSISGRIGCEVHSFDPSLDLADHLRKPTIHFHATGLDGGDTKNNGWKMESLKNIRKELGHTNSIIDVIKIDIEESEWIAFPDMFVSGSLNNVKQICFEIHFLISLPDPDPWRLHKGLSLFKNLYNLGYRIFKSHGNPYCRTKSKFGPTRFLCYEVYMIKV